MDLRGRRAQGEGGLTAAGDSAGPIWALHTALGLDDVNLHLAALEGAGLLGLAEEGGRTTVYLRARPAALELPGTWEQVPDADWNTAWRAHAGPVQVGGLRVSPPWAAADGDVVIDPGQAFGTGHHETTTGCLAALQELDLGGLRVLDVGTGSGVLAIAALRLGAAGAVAVDTDPLAVAEARANAERNGVDLDVREGSVEAAGPGPFDLVTANLDTDTLRLVAGDLAAAARPNGTLLVSGVSVGRAQEALGLLEAAGLRCWPRTGEEWLVIVARPEPAA